MTELVNTLMICDVGEPIPSGAAYTPGATNGGGSIDYTPYLGTVTFTCPSTGLVTITILDGGVAAGDVYELILDGVSLGHTSEVALLGGVFSTRTWNKYLTAGSHTIKLWDIILSYDGETSPFGGGTVSGMSPAGAYLTVNFTASTSVRYAIIWINT